MRSIALASVAVPTVERGFEPIRSWSTMIAVVRPSNRSTSGRSSVGMKPCTNALYVSLINRCDSAAIVSNTSELLPEPETPVNTVSRRFGISTLTSLRLFSRAPCTRIRSWLSAACRLECAYRGLALRLSHASAQLLDADHVAGRVTQGAVANPYGCSVGSCMISVSPACSRSKMPSRSFVANSSCRKCLWPSSRR